MVHFRVRREKQLPPVPSERQLNVESITWGGLTWTHIEKPTEQETAYLSQHYSFHPLNLDDVLSRIQRPKIDEYKDHLFIVSHFPYYDPQNQLLVSSEMDMFIGENYLVTIDCTGNLQTLGKFFKLCLTDEEERQKNLGQGPAFLLYRVVDKMVDYCFPMLSKIADDVERVEDNIFSDNVRGAVRELSVIRRDIITFRRIIWPMRAVVGSLEPRIRRFAKTDLEAYFGDLVDHVDRIWDGLDEYKEVIEGLDDTHYSLASNRINEVLRILTILTTIGTVLTVVVSFFGMNVALPGGANPGGHPFSWVIVLAIMLAIIAGMLYFFSRRRWL